MASELVPVEQVDRDAAAECPKEQWELCGCYGSGVSAYSGFQCGDCGGAGGLPPDWLVNLLARHRRSALEAQASRIAELEAGLPDYIEIYRIMRAAGRKRSDMARAVAEQLASVRARTLLGDREG